MAPLQPVTTSTARRRPCLIERTERAERALILITTALGEDLCLPEPHRSTLRAIAEQLRAEQRGND